MQLTVTVCHDEAERVWFVQSSEVPGLNAEAATLDALMEVIADVTPDLIAAKIPELEPTVSGNLPICVQYMVNPRPHAA